MSGNCDELEEDKLDEARDYFMMAEIYGNYETGYNESKAGYEWAVEALFKNADEMTSSEREAFLQELYDFNEQLELMADRLEELKTLLDQEYMEYKDAQEKEKNCVHEETEVSMKLKETE